jgi:Flp pilus assembly pilin Flp
MKLSSSEIGQGLVEYALLLVFIAIVIIVILEILGISVFDLYDFAISKLVEVFS